MKVLMFGWEFPPHISGGLGTACHGLTQALCAQDVEILFVLPRCPGDHRPFSRFELRGADEVSLTTERARLREVLSTATVQYLEIESLLTPYLNETTYRERLVETRQEQRQTVPGPSERVEHRLAFSGHYGQNLLDEVSRFAVIGGRLGASESFEMIHAHDWMTYLAGVEAKLASGKPLICHCHATEFDRGGDWPNADIAGIERFGLELADRVLAVSQRTKDTIVRRYGIPAAKIAVVHNAVTKEIHRQRDQLKRGLPEKLVLFLGRVTQQKGPNYFVEAAHRVRRELPDVRFVMAGAGDLLPRMIERVAALRLADRFHFTGFLRGEEVEEMFALSDLYVMPSVSEPFGITPFEAMLYHLPVIVSRQSGVTEVLRHAVKVDFWDVERLAASITEILSDDALAARLAAAAAHELDRISWDTAALKVRHHYEELRRGAAAGGAR